MSMDGAKADPALSPLERETNITFSVADDKTRVSSEEASIIRWLLEHPEYEEEDRREHDDDVVFITGKLPIGCLMLKGKPRKSNHHSRITGEL